MMTTDTNQIEPTADRLARWLAEAEQYEQALREQWAAMHPDDEGKYELRAGDVWSCLSLPPATATLLTRGDVWAFWTHQIIAHRGPCVVASTLKPFTPGFEHGKALGVVWIEGDEPFNKRWLPALGMHAYDTRLARSRVCFVRRDQRQLALPFSVRGEPNVYRIIAPAL